MKRVLPIVKRGRKDVDVVETHAFKKNVFQAVSCGSG